MSATSTNQPAIDGIPEAIEQPELDFLLHHWARLAAIAHNGFLDKGRGSLCVSLDTPSPQAEYRPGPPCECHQQLTEQYDPNLSVVFLVRADGQETVVLLTGLPTPAECFAQLAPELFAGDTQ